MTAGEHVECVHAFDQVGFDRTSEARIIRQDVRASFFVPLNVGRVPVSRLALLQPAMEATPFEPLSRHKEETRGNHNA